MARAIRAAETAGWVVDDQHEGVTTVAYEQLEPGRARATLSTSVVEGESSLVIILDFDPPL